MSFILVLLNSDGNNLSAKTERPVFYFLINGLIRFWPGYYFKIQPAKI